MARSGEFDKKVRPSSPLKHPRCEVWASDELPTESSLELAKEAHARKS